MGSRSSFSLLVRLGPAVLLAAHLPAAAWDPESHVSIVKAALAVSPDAGARIDTVYTGDFFSSVKEPDPLDLACKSHPTLSGRREAALQAEAILRALGSGALSPYNRAKALGRYLHFVADAAMPQGLLRSNGMPPRFFEHTAFVVFREPTGLTLPLANSLRAKGAGARWGTDSLANHTSAYRLAVNLVADALLLLPAPPGASPRDPGPVVFPVNRVDNGRGAKLLSTRFVGSDETYDYYEETYQMHNPTHSLTPLPDQRGLKVVEWNVRPGEKTDDVRAVLFNNDPKCATRIVLTQGSWERPLPVTLAPFAVRTVELQVPAGARGSVAGSWSAVRCSGPFGPEMGASSAIRLIVPVFDKGPVFGAGEQLIDMTADGTTTAAPKAQTTLDDVAGRIQFGAQPTPRATAATRVE